VLELYPDRFGSKRAPRETVPPPCSPTKACRWMRSRTSGTGQLSVRVVPASAGPIELVRAVLQMGAKNFGVVPDNCAVDDWGLGLLLEERRIAK